MLSGGDTPAMKTAMQAFECLRPALNTFTVNVEQGGARRRVDPLHVRMKCADLYGRAPHVELC